MSKREVQIHLNNLTSEATSLGLMNEGDRLLYSAGSRTNGVSPDVYIARPKNDGTTRDDYLRPDFLPRFTLKNTSREVALIVESAYRALFAVNHKP